MIEEVIEKLAFNVDSAEKARKEGDLPAVGSVYQLWLGKGEISPVNITVSQLREKLSAPGYDNDHELLAVGLLGLQRIQLVAAISEFKKNGDLNQETLAIYAQQYKLVFTALLFMERVPQTIHYGTISWFAEYYQDLANYFTVIGAEARALETIEKGIDLVEDDLIRVQKEAYKAGQLSGLSTLYMRKGRLTGDIENIFIGVDRFKQSERIAPNPDRRKDIGRMVLKEVLQNSRKNNLIKTVRATMLGLKLLF